MKSAFLNKINPIHIAVLTALSVMAQPSHAAPPTANPLVATDSIASSPVAVNTSNAVTTSSQLAASASSVTTETVSTEVVTGAGTRDERKSSNVERNATLNQNYLTNNGTINYASGPGIDIQALTNAHDVTSSTVSFSDGGGVTTNSDSKANGFSNSTVSNNFATNTGNLNSQIGVRLNANSIAYANASASATSIADTDNAVWGTDVLTTSATATVQANAYGRADVTGNNVNNSGLISATTYGIQLKAGSQSNVLTQAVAHVTMGTLNNTGASGSGNNVYVNTYGYIVSPASYAHNYALATLNSSISYALSNNNSNILSNSGTITVSGGVGIEIYSTSYSTSYSDNTNASGAGANSYNTNSNAYSYVNSNNLTNTGWIAANGGQGIYLHADANLQASGMGYNLASVDSNTITNSGYVYSTGNAIELTASTTTISGLTGLNSDVSLNTITNNYPGRIVSGADGIYIHATTVQGNAINNSGLIVSDPGMTLSGTSLTKSNPSAWDVSGTGSAVAIQVNGVSSGGANANNLNLNAPAYLAGRILLATTSDTNVNLTSGISHSVRWAFQHATTGGTAYSQVNQAAAYTWTGGSATWASLSGTVPWFVNQQVADVNGVVNDVYATIDPSAFAAAPNQLADLTDMVSSVSREGMAKNTDATDGFWLSAQGGVMNYDGNNSSTMKQDTNLYSVALGYNRTVLDDYRVGLVVGYSDARFDSGSFYKDLYGHSYNNKATGGYLGARATTKLGVFDVDAGLSAGFQNHDDKRFVNDNLVWWGQSTATSSYNSYWFSPELGVALPISMAAGFTVSPNVRFTYSGQHIDSYTESGTNSNATVDSRYIGVIESKLGLNIANSFGPVDVCADIGYMARSLTGDDKVKVAMIGDIHDVSFYYRDLNAGYLKARASLNINEKVQASVIANYTNATNAEGGNVMGAVKVSF